MKAVVVRIAPLLLLLAAVGIAHAAVDPTDGSFRTEVVDLSVKVPGGSVGWSRSYERQAWRFTPAWEKLVFTFDDFDGSVQRIERSGNTFEKIDSAGTLFRFSPESTIRRTDSGWRWADRSGNWVDYAEQGRALRFGNRSGDSVELHYSGEQLTSVSDRNGRTVLTLTWNGAQLAQVQDHSGRTVRYAYTGGQLSQVTDVRGEVWKYEYTGSKLSKLIDPLNRATTLTLSDTGRTRRVTWPDGSSAAYLFEYLSGPKQYYLRTTRLNGDKEEVTETWTDRERELVRRDVNGVTVMKVQRDGRKRIHTDYRGRRTTYDYDEFDNPTGVLYPNGAQTRTTYTHAGGQSQVQREIDERGTITEHAYNAQGLRIRTTEAKGTPVERRTTYAYDAQGRLESVTQEGDATTAAATTRYQYDAAGNLIQITDAEGGETRFEDFDALGNARTRIDARNERWTSTYDAAGNLLSQTDPLGHTTTHSYDEVGNRRSTTFPPATAGEPATTTQYHYDAGNRLTRTRDHLGGERITHYDAAGNRIEEIDEAGKTTKYAYDRFNRLSTITDGNGNVTRYVYPDPSGDLTHAGDLYQPIRIEYPTFQREMQYDLRDRVHAKNEVFANAQGIQRTTTRTTFDAVGNAIEVIDAASRRTRHTYDERNRLTSTTDALNGVTRYAYDARDNLLSLTDANSNTHRFTYDRLNRTKTESRPMGQTHRYAYDAAGNLVEKIDARNQKAEYVYDEAGRRATIRYTKAGESTPHKTVSFTYNARNVLTGYNDGITSGEYTYDELQRKTQEAVDYGEFTWTYRYSYYPNGQKASYTAIDGTTFSYGYDAAKNLASIVIPNEGTIEYGDYRWTRPGRVSYPGNTVRTLTYDGLLRSERILVQNAANETLMDYRYQYDAAGNITEKQTEHGPYRYEYDQVDRLTVADYPNGPNNDQINDSMAPDTFPFADDRYTYDLLGNRLTDQRQTQAFQWQYNQNNELLHSGFATYEYNESGSTTAKKDPNTSQPIQRYGYNSEERMEEVRDAEGNLVAEYYYDPFGRRLWKTLYPGAEGYSGSGEPLREYWAYDESGYSARIRNNMPPQLLIFGVENPWSTALLAIRAITGEWTLIHQDGRAKSSISHRRGTLGLETRRSGEFDIAPDAAGMGFPGQVFDVEVGQYYNLFRMYAPDSGRYSETDPLGVGGGLNFYVYAANRPTSAIDPWGLKPIPTSPYDSRWNESDRIYCDPSRPTSGDPGFRVHLAPSSGSCSGSKLCAVFHEATHAEDVYRRDPMFCRKPVNSGMFIGESDGRQRMRDEARAFNRQCECLQAARKSYSLAGRFCETALDCQFEIEDEICMIDRFIRPEIEQGTYGKPRGNSGEFNSFWNPRCFQKCNPIEAP